MRPNCALCPQMLISGTKGIDADGRWLTIARAAYAQSMLGCYLARMAEEIADGQYTGTVVASADAEACALVQEVMRNERLRVYVSADLYGVELGGALQNTCDHLWLGRVGSWSKHSGYATPARWQK